MIGWFLFSAPHLACESHLPKWPDSAVDARAETSGRSKCPARSRRFHSFCPSNPSTTIGGVILGV